MNKYCIGLFAISLSFSLTAYNKLKKSSIIFDYQPSTYSQAQVQNPANYAPGSGILCEGLDKACHIIVDETNTKNNRTELDPTKVTIEAADFDANTHYGIMNVSVSTGSSEWLNKD